MSPQFRLPTPTSPNSWTARSFTTLRPSDSPSQAQFPKYSQASLLIEARTERPQTAHGQKQQSIAENQRPQTSFMKRNRQFIALAVLSHISVVALSTLLALIITAATSHPRKRIRPGFCIGVIVSFASALASIIIGYVKWHERTTKPPSGEANRNIPHQAELGGLRPLTLYPLQQQQQPQPSPTDLRAAVSNWGTPSAPSPRRLRALISASRNNNPLPSASARLAGSNNRPLTAQCMELQSLPPHHHHQQQHPDPDPDSDEAARELETFLVHELHRQDRIKRRISTWLATIPSAPSPSLPSSPSQQSHHTTCPISYPAVRPARLPTDTARLAQIDAEIEADLGIPASAFARRRDDREEYEGGLGVM
ncbi:MAG: hypothetical protein L6R39_007125, partial [Caloplaca ligustica]